MEEERQSELRELLEEVRRIDVQSKRLVTEVMAGGYLSVFRGCGIEFSEVREYADGDDPRSVDWNVTARMGRPFVKRYVDEREQTLLFLLDLSASMTGSFGIWSARQAAARFCACLALAATRNGDKVGLVSFGEKVEAYAPPGKGVAHALRIVRDCLALPARAGRTDYAPALQFVTRAVRRRAIVFLVSDFLGTGLARKLAPCARRHDLIAVRILPPELSPPAAGLLRLRDPETGAATTIDFGSARVRAEYAQRVEAWRSATSAELLRAKVDCMDLPIPRVAGRDPIAGPILRFFRMRELRGAKR